MNRERLEQISALLEEVVEGNTALVSDVRGMGAELSALRGDLDAGAGFRARQDLCRELVGPLGAIEAMVDRADLGDTAVVAGHLRGLAATLRGVMTRMGAEPVPVVPGADRFDPAVHRCVEVVAPADSPFPAAPPHTVVRVVEDGYTLDRRQILPVQVAIQAATTRRQPD
ncbi:nucleotide exchange factor GrpE [Dactylosporangium vinaceum]|uniref:Nucleotide exchange factor GrpE n=1 Tax=Dactylosporangium vinaceum TaxID=53362 RepID=A0ABV5M0Y5_9ACTN|nr:nucleotide exchange factor GrpE [Dactylosporangium vinaceum]UAB97225.1 nucleotide exchange factor GrpE [Dactylosporangium vinaceum]